MEQILTVIDERKRVMPRVSKAKCDSIELTHAGEELRRDKSWVTICRGLRFLCDGIMYFVNPTKQGNEI